MTKALADLKPVTLSELSDQNSNGHHKRYHTTLRKVAIVGFAPSSMSQAPFTNAEWTAEKGCEIWGLNELYLVLDQMYPGQPAAKHYDRWFDIHDPRSTISTRDEKNRQWLESQTCPIYMIDHFADIPASQRYPLTEAVAYFESDYFTNSIAYMVVLACMEGRAPADVFDQNGEQVVRKGQVIDAAKAFGEIHVYGVDMAQDSEFSHQRPSCEAAIGFARGLGIKVYIPLESDLMKLALGPYGYEGVTGPQALRAKLSQRIKEISERSAAIRQQSNNALMQAATWQGAVMALNAIVTEARTESLDAPAIIERAEKHVAEVQPQIVQAQQASHQQALQASFMDGAVDDASFWRRNWTGA